MSSDSDTASKTTTSVSGRELLLTRIINAPREKVYAAWTQPELFKQWISPRPYSTPNAEFDVRPGGSSYFIMRAPDGTDIPCPGVFLEVVPNARIVSTDAYTKAWEPSEKPFMTLTLTFEEAGSGKTKYTARISHWTIADREEHEKMGFHEGWPQCTEQLAELVENA